MAITLFFEEFFKCNNAEVGNAFLKEMCLPEEVESILRLYYIEKREQKEIALIFNLDERTIRARLDFARNLTRMKAVGWFSNYFSTLLKSQNNPN